MSCRPRRRSSASSSDLEEVTAEESETYLNAIAEASDRVVAGTAGFSVENRPLRYAIVGAPGNVSEEGLAAIQASIDELRDPDDRRGGGGPGRHHAGDPPRPGERPRR